MFNKNDRSESGDNEPRIDDAPVQEAKKPSTKDFQMRSVSYIGPNLSFTGDIAVEEGLVIEGEIEGKIQSDDKNLTVGKQGRVRGQIRGRIVEVRGKVNGDVYGDELVRLFSSAVVEGTVHCKRIIMDEGATMNGSVDMKWEDKKSAKGKLSSVDGGGETIAKVAG